MTTKQIDLAFHGSAFPSTYTGIGDIIGHPRQLPNAGVTSLYFTSDGSDIEIPLGDEPVKIEIWNETDVIKWEWARGMTNVIKTSPGTTGANDTVTTSDDTNGYVVLSGDTVHGNRTVTLSASLVGTSKAIQVLITG